jgi:hypothetical protein
VQAPLKASFGLCALAAACLASCGGSDPARAPTAVESSPIQGGTDDSTHTFAVGVMQTSQLSVNSMVAFCTGVLLAPNLVATARHCVAELSSTSIDCSSSVFGSVWPVSDVFVTTDEVMQPQNRSRFVTVSEIEVPTGPNENEVCGNDIALLVLSTSISVPEYVVPTISPPMTAAQYEPTVTAIGYGVDTPTDTTGTSAGTRRIRENIPLFCIPNDPNPSESSLDCFQNAALGWSSDFTATEFMSGDSTCEGDSGSGAYEQSNFDNGKWVAFGVLSRGGTSTDGQTCVQPIYSRFDAWGSLLISAAKDAAAAGGYALPAWADSSTTGSDASPVSGSMSLAGAGASHGEGGATSGGATSSGDGGEATAGSSPDGTPCAGGFECASGACVSTQADAGFVCATSCAGSPCPSNFTCQATYCFAAAASKSGGGCAVTGAPLPTGAGAASPAAFGLGFMATAIARRRRRRRGTRHLSASGHSSDPLTPGSPELARAHEIC